MPLLDAFFSVAVPFVIVSFIAAKAALAWQEKNGIYEGAEGAARRDGINEKFRTNQGAIVIAVLFLMLWGVMLAGLIERWGPEFFTFVIAALLLIPFATVCGAAIMVYMFAVHGYAKAKGG